MQTRLIPGDCLNILPTIPANTFDSCVTDPPYELGFMGKGWDSKGIAYNINLWREVLRVLKPGAYLLAFGGTRTYHRMACAVEDAGFVVHPMLAWIQGQGFPKATKLPDNPGWFYGRQALKPSMEPICMAQKPIGEKRMADNIARWGTGGLNVDGCRVEGAKGSGHWGPVNRGDTRQTYGRKWPDEDGVTPSSVRNPAAVGRRTLFSVTSIRAQRTPAPTVAPWLSWAGRAGCWHLGAIVTPVRLIRRAAIPITLA